MLIRGSNVGGTVVAVGPVGLIAVID
jgi:hypothetical protein